MVIEKIGILFSLSYVFFMFSTYRVYIYYLLQAVCIDVNPEVGIYMFLIALFIILLNQSII